MATLLQNILKIVRYLPTIDEHPRYEIKEEEEEEEKKKTSFSFPAKQKLSLSHTFTLP